MFNEVSIGSVLQHLSITHVIFGGRRYVDNAIFAEAHYISSPAPATGTEDVGRDQ
jgi:hypothetical protein